jgi:hypothetical protein
VPVIYQYSPWPTAVDAPTWHEVYRGSEASSDGRGFVGAIAWIPNEDTAVAVGGDGCYPRREQSCAANGESANAPPSSDADPYAGNALAWRFQDGQWQRITNLPPAMTGLTALDFSASPSQDCSAVRECGLAGGLGQIWEWHDGHFVSGGLDYQSATTEFSASKPASVSAPFDSPFRIRQIRFSPNLNSSKNVTAVAATSGCCWVNPATGQPDPAVDWPRVLGLSNGQWSVSGAYGDTPTAGAEPHAQTVPDSFYSVAFTGEPAGGAISLVATGGGPSQSIEPGSRVGGAGVAGAPSGGGVTNDLVFALAG